MNNQPFLAIEPEACHREDFPVGREGEVMDVIPADVEPASLAPITSVPDLKPEFTVVGHRESAVG